MMLLPHRVTRFEWYYEREEIFLFALILGFLCPPKDINMSAPISPRGPRPPPLPSGSSSATLLQNGRGVIRTPSSEKVNGVRPLEMAPSFASAATNIAIEAIEDVKQQWIASQMKAKAQAYSADGALSVRVGTWNVNGKACTESLTDWLGGVQNSADVLALGFQELDTSTEAYLYYDQAKEDYWSTLIEKALGERKDHYYKVVPWPLHVKRLLY